MDYEIPPGQPLRSCSCGARLVDIEFMGRVVVVTYTGGPFPQRGVEHNCDDYRLAQKIKAEAIAHAQKELSKCKGCGEPIQWQRTSAGKPTPMNLDGSSHWESCSQREQFKKSKPNRSTPAEKKTTAVETPALF